MHDLRGRPRTARAARRESSRRSRSSSSSRSARCGTRCAVENASAYSPLALAPKPPARPRPKVAARREPAQLALRERRVGAQHDHDRAARRRRLRARPRRMARRADQQVQVAPAAVVRADQAAEHVPSAAPRRAADAGLVAEAGRAGAGADRALARPRRAGRRDRLERVLRPHGSARASDSQPSKHSPTITLTVSRSTAAVRVHVEQVAQPALPDRTDRQRRRQQERALDRPELGELGQAAGLAVAVDRVAGAEHLLRVEVAAVRQDRRDPGAQPVALDRACGVRRAPRARRRASCARRSGSGQPRSPADGVACALGAA